MNLFGLKIPGSWNYFAEELENLTNFKFIDIGEFIAGIFYIPEQTPFSLSFQAAGYTDSLFMTNARTIILLYFLQFSLMIPLCILQKFKTRCPNKARKAHDFVFFNGSIRLFISSFLNILIFAMMNIQQMVAGLEGDIDFWSVILSNWLSIIFLLHCFIIPIAIIAYVWHNSERL